MGCVLSAEEAFKERRNAQVENQLIQDTIAQRNEVKVLLLGER
jgi:hypothetical protein